MIDIPVFILDQAGAVAFRNAAAEELLSEMDTISIAQSRLFCRESNDNSKLQQAISATLRLRHGALDGAGGLLKVTKNEAGGSLYCLVAPQFSPPSPGHITTTCAIVFIIDPQRTPRLSREMLRQLLGLTKAEAGVAVDLASGHSLRGIAAQQGISYDTARSHLRAIMSKTATHRQADVIALLRAGLGKVRI